MSRHVLVVGAGMAGVTVAAGRVAEGDRVTVLDKGRRHGGRMATRRIDGIAYDTGVASFSAVAPSFRDAVLGWSAAGHAAPDPAAQDRWRGDPTMRSLPQALAADCGADIHLATTVTALDVVDGRWDVRATTGDEERTWTADALVITAPAPQTLALLGGSTEAGLADASTLAGLAGVRYEPTLAVLVRAADTATGPAADGARPASTAGRTLLGDAGFSVEHLDGDRAAAARILAERASTASGVPLEVVHVHGWRYAQVVAGIDAAALRDDTAGAPLVLAGDLFEAHGDAPVGIRPEGVERAFHSGRAAAALIAAAPSPGA